MKNLPVANSHPRFHELFCVVCALPTNGEELYCNKTCEDAWVNYDTGMWDWATFYEWCLT